MKGSGGGGGGGGGGEDTFLAALVNKTATRIVMNLKMARPRKDDRIRATDRAREEESEVEGEMRERERETQRGSV